MNYNHSWYLLVILFKFILTRGEEKVRLFNTFFVSVFNSKTNCSWGIQPPELEDRDREQNKALVMQGEMVIDFLYHLNTHKSMGPDRIHPRGLKELAEVLTKPLSTIYRPV